MNRCAVIVLLSVALAACREPTAPEARNFVRSVEKRIARGDLHGLSTIFMFMGTVGQVRGMPMAQNEALQIVRDGVPLAINGFVVEEILVAPGGIGKPFVRRSLAGWPNSQEFAVLAYSDTHPGTLRPLSAGWGQQPHKSFTTLRLQIPGDTLGSWVPSGGTVDIGEALIDRECGTKEYVPKLEYAAERVQCHFALFEVAVRGELLTLADHQNPALRSFQHRHRLEIPRQRLPGIRFVTTCAERPDIPDLEEFDCLEPIRFWLDNSQYAPSLGVDVGRMKKLAHGRVMRFDRRPDGKHVKFEHDVRPDGTLHQPTPLRWTIHDPDGTLIESGSRGDDGIAVPDRPVDGWFIRPEIPPDVRRVQWILPARAIDRSASPYRVVVLNLEIGDPR